MMDKGKIHGDRTIIYSQEVKIKPRIYVSAPMRGIKDKNYPLFFETRRLLRDLSCESILPPLIAQTYRELVKRIDAVPTVREYFNEDCRNICLYADAVVVVGDNKDIDKSKGVIAEIAVARAIDVPVFKRGIPGTGGFRPDTWTMLTYQNGRFKNTTFSEWLEDKLGKE